MSVFLVPFEPGIGLIINTSLDFFIESFSLIFIKIIKFVIVRTAVILHQNYLKFVVVRVAKLHLFFFIEFPGRRPSLYGSMTLVEKNQPEDHVNK